jgi:hypothetical protein
MRDYALLVFASIAAGRADPVVRDQIDFAILLDGGFGL